MKFRFVLIGFVIVIISAGCAEHDISPKKLFHDTGNIILDRGNYTFTYNNNGYPMEYIYAVDSHSSSPVEIKYE